MRSLRARTRVVRRMSVIICEMSRRIETLLTRARGLRRAWMARRACDCTLPAWSVNLRARPKSMMNILRCSEPVIARSDGENAIARAAIAHRRVTAFAPWPMVKLAGLTSR
jgi:hypothetical protein